MPHLEFWEHTACWPEDKIEFPLIFMIRAWPVWLIAFVRLGLVFQMYSIQSGTAGETNIAHLAHIGGFFLAYALARPIAKGAPNPIGLTGHSMDGSSFPMIGSGYKPLQGWELENDPWKVAGKPLEEGERVLMKLRRKVTSSRQGGLEELAENTICPVCGGEVLTIDDRGVCRLSCHVSAEHIRWP